jgi:hypothetical protein
MLWDEVKGGRGGNEMASCLYKWVTLMISQNPNLENLTVWTDNCTGQNRNMMMISMYFYVLNKFTNLQEINHKFFLRGHTHMEVDGQHSIIERAKKKIKPSTIFTSNDWANFIRYCKKPMFNVYSMSLEDFYNFGNLCSTTLSPLINRKKCESGEPFKLSEVVWLQIRKESPGKLFF